jgi:hypothetical protein
MCAALEEQVRKKYVCPVCGFLLSYPPEDFNICPSCGVEFGAETSVYSIAELRNNWLNRGANWSSLVTPRPKGWDVLTQLRNLFPAPVPLLTTATTVTVWVLTSTNVFALA